MKNSFYISLVLSNVLLLIAFGFGLTTRKTWAKRKQVMWYIFYLGFLLLIELSIKASIWIFDSSNTSITYPIYITGEFMILFHMLTIGIIPISKRWQFGIILGGIIAFEAFWLWSQNKGFNTGFGKTISHILIMIFSGYVLLKNLKTSQLLDPFSPVYAALFLYYAASLFIFLLVNQLTKSNIVIWSVNNLLMAFLYSVSIHSFYRLKKLS